MKLILKEDDLLLFHTSKKNEKLCSVNDIPIYRNNERPSLSTNSSYNSSTSLSDVGPDQFILVSELISDTFFLGLDVEPQGRAMDHSLKKEIEKQPLFLNFSLQFSTIFPNDVDLHLLCWVWMEGLYKSNTPINYLLSHKLIKSEFLSDHVFLLQFDSCSSFFYFDRNWLIVMVKNHVR